MTIMRKEEIINILIDLFKGIEGLTVISSDDFTETRTADMLVIGLQQINQKNVGLPDYAYDIQLMLDCFISEDEDGAKINNFSKQIENILLPYNYLEKTFKEEWLCAIFLNNSQRSLTEDSNRITYNITIITSD